ncbi:MAG TPA: DUF2807 domain-containing protein [Caulobacteraceae bacterium]|nr:DUF2807 domain-containing protein [Caulobacteraceae bacterium]
MIRNLFVIACASFVLAVLCLGGAAALGGPHFFRHFAHHGFRGEWTDNMTPPVPSLPPLPPLPHPPPFGDQGAASGVETRDLAWSGADALDVDAPADVQFTQSAGPAKLTVSGPAELVDRVELSGSHLQLSDDSFGNGRLSVVLSAPNVRRFSISGDGSLAIAGYDQDELDVDVSGRGDVTAKGKARAARIDISGDGDVNLGALAVQQADADISGSGRASLAPSSAADLRISGSGEVDLLTHPAKLTSDVSGSGRIVEGAADRPS